jgi:Undecaprenyl-phosphate glucose phosphotransferase
VNRNYAYLLRFYIQLADYAVLNLLFLLAVFIRYKTDWLDVFSSNNYIALLLFTNLTWMVISNSIRYYRVPRIGVGWKKRLLFFAQLIFFHVLLMLAFNGIIKTYYSRLFFIYLYALVVVFIPLTELLVRLVIRWYQHQKGISNRIVFLGNEDGIKDLTYYFQNLDGDKRDREVILIEDVNENIEEVILALHREKSINELFVSPVSVPPMIVRQLNGLCENNLIRIRLVMDYPRLVSKPLEIVNYDSISVVNVPITPLDEPGNKMLKRFFDMIFSLFVVVFVLSWLFPIVALLIKLSSKGPVIFKQLRTGADNREFPCFKFRTMRINSEANTVQATQNDPRITKIGHFLRKTSLDEFPQFINVLRGEMSVVGPRPHMLKHTKEYSQLVGNFMQRHAIRPGVTGLAQVKGYRGEITHYELLANRVKYDRFYVENWSLALDLKIIVRTMMAIFKPHL